MSEENVKKKKFKILKKRLKTNTREVPRKKKKKKKKKNQLFSFIIIF